MLNQHTLLSSRQCLVQYLRDYYLARDTQDFSGELLILPTQRLATRLLAEIAAVIGAVLPPRIETFESFAHSRVTVELQPLSDATIELLILEELKGGQFKFLRPGHQRELRLLYGEMIENDIFPGCFADGKAYLLETIYHSDRHINTLAERLDEIVGLLESLDRNLRQRNFVNKQAYTAAVATTKLKQLSTDLQEYTNVLIAGLSSLAPCWQKLLLACSEHDQVRIVMTDLSAFTAMPLAKLQQSLVDHGCAFEPAPQVDSRTSTQAIKVESPLHEVVSAYQIAQGYVAAGVAAGNIGLILSHEPTYAPIFQSYAERLFTADNLAMTRPFASSKIGLCFSKILRFYELPEDLHRLFDWFTDPIMTAYLEREYELQPLQLSELTASRRYQTCSELFARAAAEYPQIGALRGELMALLPDQRLPMATWSQHLRELLQHFDMVAFAEERYGTSQTEALDSFFRNMELFESLQGSLYRRAEYLQIIRDQLLTADLRVIGEPLAGMQVLSLSESRYYPFEVLILLGCSEGYFPKALPKDELIDDHLKQQMKFPGWHRLEAMEDQTFQLLCERVPHFYMLRSQTVAGEPTIRSRFLERTLSTGASKERYFPAKLDQLWGLESEDALVCGPISHTTPQERSLVSPDTWQQVSASRLTNLIRCPLKYFLSVNGISKFNFADLDNKQDEGTWLHRVLEALFEQPPPPHPNQDAAVTWIESQLGQLTLSLGPYNINRKAVYFQLQRYSWPAFARYLAKLYEGRWEQFAKTKTEFNLATIRQQSQSFIETGGLLRYERGSIDAVNYLDGLIVVTDYKRKATPSISESSRGLTPQLLFYAQCLKNFYGANAKIVVGYWSILGGLWQCHGVTESARDEAAALGLATRKSPDLDSSITAFNDIWQWRETDLKAVGCYYADPSECGLCDFEDICRKNDPSLRDQVAAAAKLATYLEEIKS